MPAQYQSDPLQQAKPAQGFTKPLAVNQQPQQQHTAMASALQQTPGGQFGNISNNPYGSFTPVQRANNNTSTNAGFRSSGGNLPPGANNPNATQWNTNNGRIDTGTDQFRQFGDQMFNHTMGRLQPQMDQRNNQIRQQLINSGIREGSEAWNSEFDRMSRANNDMMSAAAVGAEQLGLQAQNQYFGQEMQNNQYDLAQNQQNYGQQFGYDQLANALQQSQIGASATRDAAASSANAARYGANQQNYRAELAHALGLNQLNEQGRQFDINNIYQTNGQNQNFLSNMLGHYGNFMNSGMQQFNTQQQANDAWYNQAGQMANNAPGVIFNANNSYVSDQIGANANHMNALGNDNQMMASFLGGMMPMSDKRVKENIEKVGRENGINIYEFDYKDKRFGEGRYRGVMAQEIKSKYPDAIVDYDGMMAVDYSKLPVNMERVA